LQSSKLNSLCSLGCECFGFPCKCDCFDLFLPHLCFASRNFVEPRYKLRLSISRACGICFLAEPQIGFREIQSLYLQPL
jgi:hypothetical protein